MQATIVTGGSRRGSIVNGWGFMPLIAVGQGGWTTRAAAIRTMLILQYFPFNGERHTTVAAMLTVVNVLTSRRSYKTPF